MNKYKMIRELEDGTMATTHLAKNLKKDEKCAIKILKKKFYSLEECQGYKEVQVMQTLSHKNVLKLHEVINDSNELLMVIDYVPENVKHVMKKRDMPFSEKETKVIMQQVFQGLSHVHKIGFMLRNLRPEALLCNEDATEIKIADFGMARSTYDSVCEYCVTPMWYMAPEVMLGALNYSTPIDLWAAGCIMAELLTGKPLFPGSDVADLMKKICTQIGTLNKSEWQDGSQMMRQQIFVLPKVEQGVGLGAAGVEASAEAKGLIMDMLVWNPERRKTAEQAVRHDFFKSDGDFVNDSESQEILSDAEGKLRTWKDKYHADLTRGSISEFEKILADITLKHGQTTFRNDFAGFENSNPLIGDSTPKSKWGTSQPQKMGGKGGSDDPFGQFRPAKFQSDMPSPRKSQGVPTSFDEPMAPREAEPRRPRPAYNSKDSLFGPDEPTQAKPGGQQKVDIMKQQNPLKYRARYGSAYMSRLLGDKPVQPNQPAPGTPMASQGGESERGQARERDPVRTRSPPQQSYGDEGGHSEFGNAELMFEEHNAWRDQMNDNNNAESNTSQVQANNMRNTTTSDSSPFGGSGSMMNKAPAPVQQTGRRKFKDNDEKYASIDHTARAEQLKQQNYVKYRTQYGDEDMRCVLGGRPSEPNNNTQKAPGQRGSYTPSWADRR